jgi:hypothetical protein
MVNGTLTGVPVWDEIVTNMPQIKVNFSEAG